MTIRNYINIHDKDTFENVNITVKPFSMFGKDVRSINEVRESLYKRAKEVGARKIELTFFCLSKFAEKVDFNLIPKKFVGALTASIHTTQIGKSHFLLMMRNFLKYQRVVIECN